MKLCRRKFLHLTAGAVALPVAAHAQRGDRVRRIGVIMGSQRISAFTQALADLGWIDGRNVRIDGRSAGADINQIRALAQELVSLQPDIIVTVATPATVAVQRETRRAGLRSTVLRSRTRSPWKTHRSTE